jgi:MoaA/NifB/PqqE/SkfB family radical SAM enzyme
MNPYLSALKIAKAHLLHEKKPLNVSYFITNRCNFRCAYCNIPETRGHHAEMSTPEIKDMLTAFRAAGMVKFSCSGGEPLLREDLGEVLDHAHALGVVTSITTNGKLIPRRAETLGSLDVMLISLDGTQDFQNTTKHNDIREVKENIARIRKNGTDVWLSTVLLKDSEAQLDFLFATCRELDCKVLLQPFHDVLAEGMGFDRKLADEPLKALFRRALGKAPELIANTPDYIDMIMKDRSLHPSTCLAGVRTCFINSNGDVFPCLPIMMHDKPTANGLRLGWRAAFDSMPLPACETCRYPNQSELFFTFALYPQTWLHMRRMLKR